jgi:hypothetical protein
MLLAPNLAVFARSEKHTKVGNLLVFWKFIAAQN